METNDLTAKWPFMGETEHQTKRKESFDAVGKARDILAALDDYRGLKGRFINLCIELAHREALQSLRDELGKVAQKFEPTPAKKNKGGNKP